MSVPPIDGPTGFARLYNEYGVPASGARPIEREPFLNWMLEVDEGVYIPGAPYTRSLAVGDGLRNLTHATGEQGTDNLAIGIDCLNAITSGWGNTAVGSNVLNALTAHTVTSPYGGGVLGNVGNVAVGRNVMTVADGAYDNTAMGTNVMLNATNCMDNVAMGINALRDIEGGSENTGIGTDALEYIVNSHRNVGIGCHAGRFLNGGLTNKIGADESIYIGFQAKSATNDATNEIVIGAFAEGGGSNTVVIGNDDIVLTELKGANVTLRGATVIHLPGQDDMAGSIAFGNGLSALTHGGGEQGQDNVALGFNVLTALTSGWGNIAVGRNVLPALTAHTVTSPYGGNVLGNVGNVAVGRNVMIVADGAYDNTAMGLNAMLNATDCMDNSAFGINTLRDIEGGSENAAFGVDALQFVAGKHRNTGLGGQAGRFLNNDENNTDSTESVYIGYRSKSATNGTTNEIVIGAFAEGAGSNTVVIGNNNITKTVLKGQVAIGSDSTGGYGLRVMDNNGLRVTDTTDTSTITLAAQSGSNRAVIQGSTGKAIAVLTNGGGVLAAHYDSAGNVGIGTATFGTSAARVLAIINGTAPSTSPANMIQMYSESGELKVRDSGGNVTTLSPHNFTGLPGGPSEDMAWSYHSERDGRAITVDMLRLARLVERLSGEKLVHISNTVH